MHEPSLVPFPSTAASRVLLRFSHGTIHAAKIAPAIKMTEAPLAGKSILPLFGSYWNCSPCPIVLPNYAGFIILPRKEACQGKLSPACPRIFGKYDGTPRGLPSAPAVLAGRRPPSAPLREPLGSPGKWGARFPAPEGGGGAAAPWGIEPARSLSRRGTPAPRGPRPSARIFPAPSL